MPERRHARGAVPRPAAIPASHHVGEPARSRRRGAGRRGSSRRIFVQYARSTELRRGHDRQAVALPDRWRRRAARCSPPSRATRWRAATLRPISELTATARKIAATRDPSRRIPEPEADDEVAELARTLDQMLRELDAARAETEQMIQAQREFVADASHELRTPLTSILANLELLQARLDRGRAAPARRARWSTRALASSRRMSRLVSDLLLLARADAGRVGLAASATCREIAAAAMSEVRPVADGHELRLEANGPVTVNGNPDELHRLALNLLENGLRHTPRGDRDLARWGAGATATRSWRSPTTGPGSPRAGGDALFARFVRGSGPADTSADGGAGLGLAIVKAVATAHGGDVEAGRSEARRRSLHGPLPLPSSKQLVRGIL